MKASHDSPPIASNSGGSTGAPSSLSNPPFSHRRDAANAPAAAGMGQESLLSLWVPSYAAARMDSPSTATTGETTTLEPHPAGPLFLSPHENDAILVNNDIPGILASALLALDEDANDNEEALAFLSGGASASLETADPGPEQPPQ